MARIDRGFDPLSDEMREMRTEMHAEFRVLRAELNANQRQIARVGWWIAGALMLQLLVFVVAQS